MRTEATQSIMFLHPFLERMRDLGIPRSIISERLGVVPDEIDDPAIQVRANTVYAFLRWCSEQLDDDTFCARIGCQMARGSWAPLLPLLTQKQTVWQFLTKFSAAAEGQGGSASYRLEVEGQVALWKLKRPATAASDAVFADATAVGFFVEILRGALGKEFRSDQLLAVTSKLHLIPDDVLPATSILHGASGMTLRFPASWLEVATIVVVPHSGITEIALPAPNTKNLVEQTRRIVQRRIADPDFGISETAAALGMSVRTLQSGLGKAGANLSEIRQEVRRSLATEWLQTKDMKIAEIAASLGYTSSSNFTRAFRAWTGQTPGELRRTKCAVNAENKLE
ncbi:helix-turn-helix transcriptional regulator [Ruegeria hyattellae]|uniref:helix-turn-helix transcriptional regulator n=1 Tax=Ruegeria hyattellae TaxID=3233337 RepID=UPI00355C3031